MVYWNTEYKTTDKHMIRLSTDSEDECGQLETLEDDMPDLIGDSDSEDVFGIFIIDKIRNVIIGIFRFSMYLVLIIVEVSKTEFDLDWDYGGHSPAG